jgi:translation initiation factor IF-2
MGAGSAVSRIGSEFLGILLERSLATRRVHNIARDLNIDSKAIVDKCHAEGISADVIKNHMSIVSAGLEATIREWFSGHAGTTAIETAEKVDVEKAKAKPRSRAARKASDDGEGATPIADSGSTAIAEPPSRPTRVKPAASASDEGDGEPVISAPATTPLASRPITPSKPVEVKSEAPVAPAAKVAAPAIETKPTASPSDDSDAPPAPVHAVAIPHKPTPPPPPPPPPARSVTVAPQNVPTRPKIVSPAGPKLQIQTPVKLAGPKVVRVEAPEVIEAPRPRRVAPGESSGVSSRGPRGGSGVTSIGGGDDDRRRAGGGGGGAPTGPGAANKRRTAGQGGVPDRRKGRSGDDAWVGSSAGVFSEQDLIEREARLLRSTGLLKKRKQDLSKKPGALGAGEQRATPAEVGGKVKIVAPFSIKDLSAATGVKGADIVKKLFLQNIMATINSPIDVSKAQEIMFEYDIELEIVDTKTAEEAVSEEYASREAVALRPRGPVVTILGHVDHGKTSLLDRIRNANVAAGEAGGITQRTSAFRVPITIAGEQKEIVFFDTPGHQAFTEMRSRGANMTDIVVLVVSPADGGVMPQTVESIAHAKAAKVPIVVALNKIDRPEATDGAIQKTLGQLAEQGLNPQEWGGDTEVIRTSATVGTGIEKLLETLDLQAQLLELKADFGGHARGNVVESRVQEGRGPVATILIRDGKLSVGDFIVAGPGFGRVRDITDDRGQKLKEALPPMPVQISGLDEVPDAGDRFFVTESLREAQDAAEQRRGKIRETQLAQPKVTLDNLFSTMGDSAAKEILVVVKAAEQGTVDVLKNEIEKIKTPEVKARVLHAAVGGITESDVLLAEASKAVIIGFNVIASGKARTLADQKGVQIRPYQVIYHITDDLKKAAEGLLAPELRQEVLGHAEVRKVYKVTKVGAIAGCYVTDGIVQRDALIRVTRNDVVVENDRKLEQLKRFKDDAKEVRAGMECGMKIAGYDDIKEGDILECYKNVEVKRTL